MVTPQEYITSRLQSLKDTPEITAPDDLKEFIFQTIMSKKFRKFSVAPEYITHIRGVIDTAVANNTPIKFIFPFGAYKLWRLAETPEPDWAELFTLMHNSRWLMPIAKVYKPGVHFDFISDDVIIERLNNIPKCDTETYMRSFRAVVDFLVKYIPSNLKFTLTSVSSLYPTIEDFEAELTKKIVKRREEFGETASIDEEARRSVELNVKLRPSQADDPFWRERVEFMHQAYRMVSLRRPYYYAKDTIFAFCMRLRGDKCVSIGTTKTSVAKFWVGVGALKPEADRFREYVLSPSQLETAKFNEVPISISSLTGRNFRRIKILV